MSRSIPLLVALLAACAGVAPGRAQLGGRAEERGATQAGAERLQGLPVLDISFSPPSQPIPAPRLRDLIAIRQGAPLDPEEVRRTIRQMFATGRYNDIQVDATRSGDGVRIMFITVERWFIGPVKVLNVKEPPTAGQLVAATNLVLGEEYSEEKVKAAEETLRRALAENGLYKASIEIETGGHSDTQQIDIAFQVTPGPRAQFGEIRLSGNPDLTVDQVRRISKWHANTAFTQPTVQKGIERLRRHYQRADHLQATIRIATQKFVPESDRVNLVLEINPGPRVEVAVSGAKLTRKQLRRYVPIYEEGTIDRDLLAEGARNLRDFFQTNGYFEAEVDYDQQQEEKGAIPVEFQVTLGEHHEFVKLDITGNRYFDRATLRERMFLQPKNLQLRWGRYSQSLLRNDIATIEELYRANGFLSIKVDSRVEDHDYLGKKGDIAVFLTIVEGPQTFVSKLQIAGNRAISTRDLLERISSAEGQPYSETNLASDRDQILAYYFNEGFSDASLETRVAPGAEPNRVELEYTIQEGPRQFVNKVIVDGYQKTREYVIDRQLRIHGGQAVSQDAMIESQRRLYDLGIFSKVDMAIQNKDGEEPFRNVLFELEEARRWTIGFGGGAEIARFGGGQFDLQSPAGATGFSPRVSVEVNRLNMLGRANTLSLRTRFSTLQKRGVLSYQAPEWRGKERLTLTYSSLYDQSRNVNTFSATRLEGALQLQHRISKPTSLFYRYSYRRVSVDENSLAISPLLIPLLSQPVRVGLLSVSAYQDRRDDPVDAKRGIYNSIDLGVASFYTGSGASFSRLLMQNSTYRPLTKRIVLARTTQFGALTPFGRLRRVGDRQTREIPLPERFFSGGSNTQRGFPINQAGPRDLTTGFPIGGNGLFLNSVELRFPLRGENIGGVLFHDAGNVYSQPQNLSFRVHQRPAQRGPDDRVTNEDFDYMVHAVGFGVRYRTPIGPVRIDLAYSINSPRFVGFRGTRDELLACGRPVNPPPCATSEQRISRFQFHFSLGQTF